MGIPSMRTRGPACLAQSCSWHKGRGGMWNKKKRWCASQRGSVTHHASMVTSSLQCPFPPRTRLNPNIAPVSPDITSDGAVEGGCEWAPWRR